MKKVMFKSISVIITLSVIMPFFQYGAYAQGLLQSDVYPIVMDPEAMPAPETEGPVVSLGFGSTFSLHLADFKGISIANSQFNETGVFLDGVGGLKKGSDYFRGPYFLKDTAPEINAPYGTTNIDIKSNGFLEKSEHGVTGKNYDVIVKDTNDMFFEFIPREGLLKGVKTTVSGMTVDMKYNHGLDAVVKYDGKEETVAFLESYTAYPLRQPKVIGTYPNLESVTLKTKGKNGWMSVPSLTFKVVSEDLTKPDPVLPERKYEKPDITPVQPENNPPVTYLPTVESALAINEVCAGNTLSADPFGDFSDWIELYNSSDSAMDISGYGITDNPLKPYKYTFEQGTVIDANSFKVIYASDRKGTLNGNIYTGFSISKSGETVMLSDKDGEILSVMELPSLKDDESFSRVPDASGSYYTTLPTRGFTNNQAEIVSTHISPPVFSTESGFYSGEFDLEISGQGDIYYTTDGSVPTGGSTKYTGPITVKDRSDEDNYFSNIPNFGDWKKPKGKVSKSTVVRAAVIDGNGNSSEVVSKTFFVDLDIRQKYNNSMVISFSTDEANLFSNEFGIFKNNSSGSDWERRTHMSMFEGDGNLVADQDVGIRLRGFGSRTYLQKSLTVHARSEYGNNRIEHPIWQQAVSKIDGSVIPEHKSFALRSGSQQQAGLKFMDSFTQYLGKDLDAAWQAARPCVVFINGEYWGLYYIQERVSDEYVEAHYGIPKDDVVIVKNHTGMGTTTSQEVNGYLSDRSFLGNSDFTIQENYDKLIKMVDIENMMFYYAANLAIRNNDWGEYNFACWKSRNITDRPYEDGKWRFLLYDQDRVYARAKDDKGYIMHNLANKGHQGFLMALQTNPSLRRILINTLFDVYSTAYSPYRAVEELEYWYNEFLPHSVDSNNRYDFSSDPAVTGPKNETYSNIAYFGVYFSQAIAEHFGLSGDYTHLKVNVNDPAMGTVKVNSITPDFSLGSYTGWYLNDITSTLTAMPKEGYRFTGWTASDGTALSSIDSLLTYVTINKNGSYVMANFEVDANVEGSGTDSDPYKITSAEDLAWMSNVVNNSNDVFGSSHYMLTESITLTGEDNHTPIGTASAPFNGSFDGRFHTISNIDISTENQGSGLFGYVGSEGIVQNTGVVDINIAATTDNGKNVGGVVGNNDGLIKDCFSSGTLSGRSTVGGIAGNNKGGSLINCHSVCSVSLWREGDTSGGIAGKIEARGTKKATVVNCYSLTAPIGRIDDGCPVQDTAVKTAGEFADGTVAALLNANGSENIWASGGMYPIFKGTANITLEYQNGKIKITAKQPFYSGTLIIAKFSGETLQDIDISGITGAGAYDLPVGFEGGSGYTVKVFLVDHTDILQPLADNLVL